MAFIHYQRLSKTFQHLLPSYWLAGLLRETHKQNPNQVRLYLEGKDDPKKRLTRVPPQSYLYSKQNGVPFRNFEKALLINQLVPHSIDILNHPAWLLIDMTEPTMHQLEVVQPLFSLPLQIELANSDAIESNKLFLLNELDRIGWIFYQLRKAQLQGDSLNLFMYNHYILKTLLYIFSVTYPTHKNNFKLYKEITSSIPTASSPRIIRRVTLNNFPQQLEQIRYESDFIQACHIYKQVLQTLVDKDNTYQNKLYPRKEAINVLRRYSYFLDLTKLKWIENDLKHTKGIIPAERETELGRLRFKVHLGDLSILPREIYLMFYSQRDLIKKGMNLLCQESNLHPFQR